MFVNWEEDHHLIDVVPFVNSTDVQNIYFSEPDIYPAPQSYLFKYNML